MYYLPPLITALLFLAIGLFVFLQNIKSRPNISFFLLCITTFGWQFSWFVLFASPNDISILLLMRIGYTFIIFLPITYYHFLVSFLEIDKQRIFVTISYLLGICFSVALWLTDKFIVGYYTFFWGYYPKAGLFHPFYLFLLTVLTLNGLNMLWNGLKLASGTVRHNQIKYVLAALILYIPASSDFVVNYGIEFYPLGFIFIAMSLSTIAYAIVRHQLMDIEVLIKKTLVFGSLFVIAFGIFVGITLLTQELIAGGRLLGLAISSFIIILAVRPLEDFLIKITDKFLFQKKYDYKHLIMQFMDELKTMILNTQDIAQSTLDFLNSSIHPVHSVILMHNKFTNKYEAIASIDFKDKEFKISDTEKIIKKLLSGGKIINIYKDKDLNEIDKKTLKEHHIELAIPLIIHKDLIGVVCLGKKKSDEEYTDEDIDVLSDLSGALSIAINNAQLFDERADAEKRAMIGTLATGINHEIGNPLNIINIRLQSFKILAKQGLLEKKTKEDIIKEVSDITDVCLENTQRIAEITKKVSEFAKPDKTLVVDKVNVSEAIDDSISILNHELALERINFKKEILCNSPHVLVDRGQLKQILFNLVKNAAQAINRENSEIIIRVGKQGKEEINIKVIDNGPGIPEANIDKIFMPFYTTKEPGKGTGLGLALVSRLVERNNGKIEVQSQVGKGTTFTLIFKGICYE